MRRAIRVRKAGSWPEAGQRGVVTLAFDDRHRRRIRMEEDGGEPFLLDLAEACLLNHGDGLELEDGSIIRVAAAAEPVADIQTETPVQNARIAWHIGNRHVPLQVLGETALRIRDDTVLVDMVAQLGARVERRQAPFAPEGGAYGSTHNHAHGRHGHHHD